MHKFIATLSRNWYCWWCCFDTFLINILEMSILSKWSYFEKSQLTYKQLFLCVKKWFQKLKIYIVFSLNIWFFISISDYFIENCGISVFNVKSTTPFFYNLFHLSSDNNYFIFKFRLMILNLETYFFKTAIFRIWKFKRD